MYIDYSYYANEYGGGLPEDEFNRREPDAEAIITYFTYVNGDIFSDTRERTVKALKLALCKATDVVAANAAAEASGEAGIKSESNDGYRVTRVATRQDGESSASALQREAYSAVRMYLLPTGWLSRSLNRCLGCCQ